MRIEAMLIWTGVVLSVAGYLYLLATLSFHAAMSWGALGAWRLSARVGMCESESLGESACVTAGGFGRRAAPPRDGWSPPRVRRGAV